VGTHDRSDMVAVQGSVMLPFSRHLIYFGQLLLLYKSRGSSVSIVSDCGLDDRAIEVRSPAEEREFFL
jgi:hypothetical protein